MDQKKVAQFLAQNAGRDMTSAEKEQQRRSFVYGNTKIENSSITRETVDLAAKQISNESSDD